MAAKSRSNNQLVEFVAKYKEVLGFLGVAGALVIACINFFATKNELDNLRCEVDLGKTALDNRIKEDRLLEDMVGLTEQWLKAKKDLGETSPIVIELALRKDSTDRSIKTAQALYTDAAEKLDRHFCRP